MTFDEEWLAGAIERSANRPGTGLHGTATLLKGKAELVRIAVEDGRIVHAGDGPSHCDFPFTAGQITSYLAGDLKLAVEYTRGDLKATGSTGAILATIDALDALVS